MEQSAHQQNVKGRVFVLAIGLNMVYLVLEAVMGLWVGSLALLADAAHNLSDVVGLALAWAWAWAEPRVWPGQAGPDLAWSGPRLARL